MEKKGGGGCFVAVNVITPIHETESNHENVYRDNLQHFKKKIQRLSVLKM